MSLTLGKTFNRQYKARFPFHDYYYDIGIFYHTDVNFNLFDVKPIYTYNSKNIASTNINMFKNIESSDFCMKCLLLKNIDNRLCEFIKIDPYISSDLIINSNEQIILSESNYIKIISFKFEQFDKNDDFLFILVERKNFLKKYKTDKIITTLSGLQISTSKPIEFIKKLNKKRMFNVTC